MKNSKNLSNFIDAWNAIPPSERQNVREDIKENGFIKTDYQFNDRKTGRVIPCEVEAIAICNAFAKYGINAVTGLPLEPKKQAV